MVTDNNKLSWWSSPGKNAKKQTVTLIRTFTHRIYFFKQNFFQTSVWVPLFSHRMQMLHCDKTTFLFLDEGQFFWTFTLQANVRTNHDGCAERTSSSWASPITLTTVVNKLILCVSQCVFELWGVSCLSNTKSCLTKRTQMILKTTCGKVLPTSWAS